MSDKQILKPGAIEFTARLKPSNPEQFNALFRPVNADIRVTAENGDWVEGPVVATTPVTLPDGTIGMDVEIEILRKGHVAGGMSGSSWVSGL